MELLNGKAKELFEKWLENQDVAPYKVMFYDIPIIVQQSYIIEWLDSVNIHIEIGGADFQGIEYWFNIQQKNTINGNNGRYFNTRQEATAEAIKKAVELINESNGK